MPKISRQYFPTDGVNFGAKRGCEKWRSPSGPCSCAQILNRFGLYALYFIPHDIRTAKFEPRRLKTSNSLGALYMIMNYLPPTALLSPLNPLSSHSCSSPSINIVPSAAELCTSPSHLTQLPSSNHSCSCPQDSLLP